MKKVFTLVIDEDNEPIIVEEDVILEDILNSLASISNRIGDIQLALIKYEKPPHYFKLPINIALLGYL